MTEPGPSTEEPRPSTSAQNPMSSRRSEAVPTASSKVSEDQLLQILECPICYKPCTPPIYMCEVGHHICFECRRRTKQCIICGSPIAKTRNWIAEGLSLRIVKIRCKNYVDGCPEQLVANEMNNHVRNECLFSLRCLGDGLQKCPWRGSGQDLQRHIGEKHDPTLHSSYVLNLISNQPSCIILLHGLGHYFWCSLQYSQSDNEVYPHVRWAGPLSGVPKLFCEFTFTLKKQSEEDTVRLTWYSAVLSLKEPVPKNKSPDLSDFIKNFMDKGYKVWFTLQICKNLPVSNIPPQNYPATE